MKQKPNIKTNRHSHENSRHSCEGRNLLDDTLNTLITENLDIWTSAIQSKSRASRDFNKTYELYGIKKLSEKIQWVYCVITGQEDMQNLCNQLKGILSEALNANNK